MDFAQRGFTVDVPLAWWSTDHDTTLRVTDPTSERVLMVMVYPDSGIANAERARVQAWGADKTGRLVPGFGPSAWDGNLALVESSRSELARMYGADQDRENGLMDVSSALRRSPGRWRLTSSLH
jgi:hypothetical protein